jgi:LemA protein
LGTKTLVGCSVTPLLLTGAALAALVWGGTTYVGLTREQVDVEDAWTQMENAWLHRRQLIPDLLDAAARAPSLTREAYGDLAESAERAAAFVVTPELLNDPERCTAFLEAQGQLRDEIASFLDRHGAALAAAAPSVAERLQSQIELTDVRLTEGRERFNAAVAAYNRSLDRFPHRVVAGLFGFRLRVPWHPEPRHPPEGPDRGDAPAGGAPGGTVGPTSSSTDTARAGTP